MASESVTLSHSSTQAFRTLRIKGSLIASNWADNAPLYTVPAGKRLVLKGSRDVNSVITAADTVRIYAIEPTSPLQTLTLVLTAGTNLITEGARNFLATGFLEDDV